MILLKDEKQLSVVKKQNFSFKAFFIILGLMLVSVILCITIFVKTSIRLDESQSLFQISRNIPGLLKQVGQDVHVPLYHILLHYWTLIFGSGIVVARYMSIVFFLATIPAVYFLGKSVYSRRIGIYAATLVAINPFMLWYGAEARMYAMLAFFTVVHQILFVKIFKSGGKARYWFGFGAVTVLGLYTHYFFGFVLMTEALFYLFYHRSFAKGSFWKFVTCAVIGLGALSPWLLFVYHLGLASNTQPYILPPTSGDIFDTYAQFLFGFQVSNLNTIIVSLWPVLVLASFFALQKSKRSTSNSIFLIMMAVVPVIGAYVFSILIKPFFLSRYLIVSLPSLLLVLTWIMSIYPKKVRRVIEVAVILATIGLLIIQIINPDTPVKEDYKDAVAYVSQKATAQDVIVATAPFTIYPIEYYYQGPAKLTTQPIWDRFASGSAPGFNQSKLKAETDENVASYQDAFLILSYDQGYNAKIRNYYDSRFERIDMKQFSPGLVVYEYKIRYDPSFKI